MQLAKGFSLFIAVCNSPATSRKLIDLLQESMPGVEIEIVDLDERTEDPLREVADRLTPGKSGPVMVLGLEKAVPSSLSFHPVLQALNLQRPEWRTRIQRPVVLWVPEYVHSLLGIGAPDFQDWRSDTLFFPSEETEFQPLVSTVWSGGLDGRMAAEDRRTRIEELRSRLQGLNASSDRAVLAARSSWLTELGNHLLVLGDLDEAEAAYLESMKIEQELQRLDHVAVSYNNLGTVSMMRSRPEEAAEMYEKSLSIAGQAQDRPGLASGYANLAVAHVRSDPARAENLLLKALELYGEHPDHREMAMTYSNLAQLYVRQSRYEEAQDLLHKAFRLSQEVGDRLGVAAHLRILAEVYFKRGDYAGAEACLRKALAIDEEILHRDGMARDFALLADLNRARGNLAEARRNMERALELWRSLGNHSLVQALAEWARKLPATQ